MLDYIWIQIKYSNKINWWTCDSDSSTLRWTWQKWASTAGFLWVRLKLLLNWLLQHFQVWWLNDRVLIKVVHLQALFFLHIVGCIKSCPGWFPCLWKNDSCALWSLFLGQTLDELWLSLMKTLVRPVCVKVKKVCALERAELSPPETRCDCSQQTAHRRERNFELFAGLIWIRSGLFSSSSLSDVRARPPPSCWWRVCKPASSPHHFYPPCFYYHDFLINLSLLFLITDLLLIPIDPLCISSPLIT